MSNFIHRLALCEGEIGEGTNIWPFAHVMKGAVIGKNVNVCGHAWIEGGVLIGDNCTIKNGAIIYEGAVIEDDCFIGPGCIITNDVMPRMLAKLQPEDYAKTYIRRGASLGAGSIIRTGITVGEHAMVGSGAVVTKDVLPHRIVVGTPAKSIGAVCACGKTFKFGSLFEAPPGLLPRHVEKCEVMK